MKNLQVRKKFKHAVNFGIRVNPKQENFELFQDTMAKNMQVLDYFNEDLGLNEMIY